MRKSMLALATTIGVTSGYSDVARADAIEAIGVPLECALWAGQVEVSDLTG
jgi:hypothetical protein